MSRIQPMQTNINQNKYFFQLADVSTMNSGSISTGSITTSSLGAINGSISSLYTDALTASTATISSVTANHISTNTMDVEYMNNSTIYSLAVFVDGAELATVGGSTLLLNGLPIATTNNLSSLSDWSFEPAVNNVNMNGFSLYSTNTISSVNVQAQNGIFQNLMAMNIFSISSFTSTISSLNMVTNNVATSSITEKGAAQPGSYITLFGGDITIDSAAGGAGIFLTPQDEVLINGGLAVNYIRAASSIQDVSTINSIPYPPPGTGSTISSFQTLTASQWISSPELFVSSINGSEFNQNTIVISTIQTEQVSSVVNNVNLSIASSMQLRPSGSFSPNLNIDMGLGSLFTNVAGAALGGLNMIVGSVALATGITAVAMGRQSKTITNSTFELVNTTTQLQVSTLGQQVSSIVRYVSSVNPQTPGQEIFVSTIIPAGTPVIRSFSDPMNTISSPASSIIAFGQWVALPPQGVGGSFSTIVCSTLVANVRVSTTNIDVANIISTNGLSCGFSIASALVSTPQLFVSSVNSAPYPPTQQIISTFPGSIYVGDSVLVQNQVSTTNLNVSNITSTNGLSAGYVISNSLVSTPITQVSSIISNNISTANISLSTINNSSLQSYFPATRIGQYYKSAAQTLNNGNTDITFDLQQSWNNTGGYITHTSGTTDFTVAQAGIYQLEFNCVVLANGAVYSLTTIGKSVSIDITRTPITEQTVVSNSALQASAQNYAQSVNGTFYLAVGDVINLRVGNTFTSGGPPTVQALLNTFDLNTFFTWTYVG